MYYVMHEKKVIMLSNNDIDKWSPQRPEMFFFLCVQKYLKKMEEKNFPVKCILKNLLVHLFISSNDLLMIKPLYPN